jgi:predicted SAM-dependent methyltransferase
MNLNIGSSAPSKEYKKKEWINLDIVKHRGVNVVGSGYCLPFENESLECIHSCHVLEHLPRDKWPLMLQEMQRVLSIGGLCYVEVPDFPEQIKLFLDAYKNKSRWQQHLYRTAIYGKTEREGMGHQFGFTWELLRDAFHTVGFTGVKRVTDKDKMISRHIKDGPVILVVGNKDKSSTLNKLDLRSLSFDNLRKQVLI